MTKARQFVLLLLMAVLTVGAAGCGKDKEEIKKEEAKEEVKPNEEKKKGNDSEEVPSFPVQDYITTIKGSENLRVITKEQSKSFTVTSKSSLSVSKDYLENNPVSVGDIICIRPSKDNIWGFTGKVVEISQSNGSVQLKTEYPALDEIFDELELEIDGLPYSEPLLFDAYGNLIVNNSISKSFFSDVADAVVSGYDWYVDQTTFDVLEKDIHVKDVKFDVELSDKKDDEFKLFGLLGQEEPIDKDKYDLKLKLQNKVSVDMENFKCKIAIDPLFGLRNVSCSVSELTITDEISLETSLKLKGVDLRTDTPKKDAENKKEIKVGYLAWPLTIGPIVLWIQTGVYASFGVDATFSLKRNQTFTLKANNVEFLIDKLETLNFPKITCESPVIEKGPMKTTFSVKGEISAGAGWEIISLGFFTPDNKLGLKTDVDLMIDAEFEMTDEISEEGSNFSVDFPSAKAVLDYHIKGFYNFEISSWCKFMGEYELYKKPLWKWEGYILPKFSDFQLIADHDTRIGSYRVTKNNFFGGLMTSCEFGVQYLDVSNNVLYDYKDEYEELPQTDEFISSDSYFGNDQKYLCSHMVFDSRVFYARNYIKFPFWVPFADDKDSDYRYFYYNYQNFPLSGVVIVNYSLSAQTVVQNGKLTISGTSGEPCDFELSVGNWGESLPSGSIFSATLPTSVAGTFNGKIVAKQNGKVVAEKNFTYEVKESAKPEIPSGNAQFHDPNINNGLVAYYPFDNDANDYSGNGNNGELQNNPQFIVEGGHKGIHFDGIDNIQSVRIPNSNSLQIDESVSFSMWFNIHDYKSLDGWGYTTDYGILKLFTKDYDRGEIQADIGAFDGDPNNTGISFFYTHNNNSQVEFASGQSLLNKWTHVVFVATNNSLKIYLNGELVASNYRDVDFGLSNKKDLWIGRMNSSTYSYPFNGMIDDFRVYNRELSPEEVRLLFNSYR